MLGSPINQYKLYLPEDFIYPEIAERYSKTLNNNLIPYTTVADYLNYTMLNYTLPGIVDKGSPKLSRRKGQISQVFPGSLDFKEYVNRTINIEMSLKASFINWMILYENTLMFLERRSLKSDIFLPDIYAHVYDDYDNILIEIIYRQVRVNKIDDLKFAKDKVGFITNSFNMELGFNDFTILMKATDTMNYRNETFEY